MFYADGPFLRRFGVPAAVSGYGSTEAGGVCHLRRWSASDDLPADAGRHGGDARPGIDWEVTHGTILGRGRGRGALFSRGGTAGGGRPRRRAGGGVGARGV